MPIQNSKPDRFTPRGLVDAYDATDVFPGACRVMQNLIFDQANPELLVSRPGVGTPITNFTGFTAPTYVSVQMTIGTMVYGMVATSRNPNKDEPFAYDLANNAFIAISGVTDLLTPTTQPTTGPWTPPTMAVISTKIIITHPGFIGAGHFFGVIDITNPAAPTWTSVNTTPTPLPSLPIAVANFGNRAYFACANVSYFSDVLLPTTITNATQQLTHGDTTPIIGYAGLPLVTTSSGVLQALIVFKKSQIWQVTGDSALSNLAQNYISLNVGCIAGRSIVQTPIGTIFIAIDGPYVVDVTGIVRPLTRDQRTQDQDLQIPFQNSVTATNLSSRIASGYTGDIFRVCVDTQILGVDSTNDYWMNTHRMRWMGPHTWPADCLSSFGNAFIICHRTTGANLFLAQTLPATDSVYDDNGAPIACNLLSSTFPKRGTMHMSSVIESTIELSSSGAQVTYLISMLDDQLTVLNQASLTLPTVGGRTWGGGSTWGDGSVWSSFASIPHVYTIPWTAPVVFQKGALQVAATAANNLLIGTSYLRIEDLGYTNQG